MGAQGAAGVGALTVAEAAPEAPLRPARGGRLADLVREPRTVALACAAVAVLVYANALGNGFAYDDVHILVDNEAVQSLATLPGTVFEPYWPGEEGRALGLWRPVTTLVYGLEYALWGGSPVGFHLVNVLLHGTVTFLAVLLLAELVPLGAAVLGGLLFAVHPVHVEAVANVVGLGELLPAVPYLAACLVVVRGGARLPRARLALVALLYALAFLAKESAVTLPAVLFLLDAARERLGPKDLPDYLRRRGALYALLGVTAAALLAARHGVLGTLASPDPALGAALLLEIPRIWTLGAIWAEYVRLLLFPAHLYADYAPEMIPILTVWVPEAVAGVVAVLALLVLGLVSWRRGAPLGRTPWDGGRRVLGLAVVWFLVTISPVSNVAFLSGVLLAERTMYLPSVGVVGGLGWLLWSLLRRRRAVGATVAALVVLLMAARTWTRTPAWFSTATVFTHMIEEQPISGRSQWVLGDILWQRGEVVEARRAYRAAVGFLDSSYRLLMEVGWDAVEHGDDRLGEFLLLRALEIAPEQPSAPSRLAILYARQGRPADVVRAAGRAVANAPRDVASWHLLAGGLQDLGRWEDAARARERVIALGEGERWQQWLSLANLRLTLGDTAAAAQALERALERAGDSEVEAHVRDSFGPLATPESSGGPGGAPL